MWFFRRARGKATSAAMRDNDKQERLRLGYLHLYGAAKEFASRFIHLADELEDDYPLAESLFADLVDLTLTEVVERTRWRPSRSFLMLLLEQRIRRDAIARAKKAKATIRRKKAKLAAEARRKAKEAPGDTVGTREERSGSDAQALVERTSNESEGF